MLSLRRSIFLPALVVGLAGFWPARGTASEDCAYCHEGDDEDAPIVTDSMLATSVHADVTCLDCHFDIEELPHEIAPKKVLCGECHVDEAEVYVYHGRGTLGEVDDLPECADCHGSHDVLSSSDRESKTNPLHLPATCGRCHSDINLAKKHEIQLKRPIELYESSVHGRATAGGIHVAATCTDCHSTGGTAHRILGQGNSESSVNHFNIPRTCGRCHSNIEQDFWEGIHGKLVARGETDTPVCTGCHGEHGILDHRDPRSRVSVALVAQATCTPCHESARLNEEYGLPAGRLASFVDSYHGLKSKAGDPTVANCASCHGAHRILPSSDPTSSVHAENLQVTCGHCHPGISTAIAQTKIHGTAIGHRTGWASFVTTFYLWAIAVIIGGMILYVVLDFWHQFKEVKKEPQIRRMSNNAIGQHTILVLSFSVLVITGFALRYSNWGIFDSIFGWDGGFKVRGIIHRGAAVLFVIGCAWHLMYLRTKEGRGFWRDILPRKRDIDEFIQMMMFNLGRSDHHPKFGRFGFPEKAEYWALVWGTVIMVVTGFLLWFDNYVVQIVPKGFLEVMLLIHFYEAWLATLAIVIWHLYGTIFNPRVYPGNPSWMTGKMPVNMYRMEHPDDPAVKGYSSEDHQKAERPGKGVSRDEMND